MYRCEIDKTQRDRCYHCLGTGKPIQCRRCGDIGMIPGVEIDDDIMNIPCPKCNPWTEPLKLTVIAVRDLKKTWTLERVPKCRWSCTVTFAALGGLHKPATLDMDQDDVEKIPECGDVMLVHKPRVVGYFHGQNAEVRHGAKDADPD